MYDWMDVETSRQHQERLLQDAERSRAVRALRARRAPLLLTTRWNLARCLGRVGILPLSPHSKLTKRGATPWTIRRGARHL